MNTIVLTPEPMTAESFAPYGMVFGVPSGETHSSQLPSKRVMTRLPFAHDGEVTLSSIWQPAAEPEAGMGFSRLERHFAVTQAFVQLSGSPAVVCVAPPARNGDPDDRESLPDPQSVKAFRIDPALGYAFHVGTWHSLDRYIQRPPGASFIIINVAPNPTQMVDFERINSAFHPDLDGGPEPQKLPSEGMVEVRFEIAPFD